MTKNNQERITINTEGFLIKNQASKKTSLLIVMILSA